MKSSYLKVCLLAASLLFTTAIWSQVQKISGMVTNQEDNKPLSGVSIVLKGKSTGTQTDANGGFSISASKADVLVFSFTGFLSSEVKVGNATNLAISLRAGTDKLDEVVVVGYGTRKRSELTGSVSSVNPAAFAHSPSTNVATALQGTVPGLRVQQSTGQPGTSPAISFRGGTNYDGTGTPLFVVDGIILPSLYGLDINDIASIDLLKDAASTAIYGARAANGVILVTTKKGQKGKTQATYSVSSTTNYTRPNSSDYLTGGQYIHMNRQGLRSRYLADSLDNNTAAVNADKGQLTGSWGWAVSSGWTSPIGLYSTQLVSAQNRQYLANPAWKLLVDPNPFAPGQMDSLLYRDLGVKEREAMILQQQNTTEHNINFSGATDQGNFALGVGTSKDDGIIIGAFLKRFNMNFNGGLNVGKALKLTTNISAYTLKQGVPYNDPAGSATGGLMQRFIGVAPTVRYSNDTSGAIIPGPNDATLGNPLYWSNLYTNSTDQQRFSGTLNLEYTILPYLKLLAGTSGYYLLTTNNFFTKAFQQGNGGAVNTTRSASFNTTKDLQYTNNIALQFNKTFPGGHSVMAYAGAEFYDFKRYVTSAVGQGAPTDLIPWLVATTSPSVFNGAIVNPSSASSDFSLWERMGSGIGRINYSYKNRYNFQGIVRYEGSSRLNKENFYGTFPGISASWNIHNEKFFEKYNLSRYVSSIKPRVGYGVNGNLTSLGYFSTAQTYNNAGTYNGLGGTYASNYINPDIRWERTNSFNAGVDLGFLKNRITANFDYFVRNVFDKISSLAISSQTGFSSYSTNLGQLQNRGVEAAVNAQVLAPAKINGFSLELGATFYTVKSYAIKLPYNGLPGNRQGTIQVWDPNHPGQLMQVNGLVEGQRIGLDEVWAPKYDGLYTSQDMITKDANVYNSFLPYNNKRIKQLGDAKWHLVNANDTMDSRQFVYVGRTTPKFTGSFYANAGYKGFHLYAAFDYAAGFVIENNEVLRGLSQVQGSQNSTTDVLKSWSPENTGGTLPRYYWANQGRNYATDGSGNNVPANLWEKGDYIMFREVTLSYDLQKNIIGRYLKNKIRSLSVYVTGSNLAYFTAYSGNFPEVGGIDNGKYPLPRRLSLGAKISL